MPIVVDSSQWTGEYDDTPLPSPIVWGEFADRAALDQAAERLQAEAWFREAHPKTGVGDPGRADNEQLTEPDENPTGADARNQRQLHVGSATAATSMLAAGAVIASGGAVLPAVAAAAAAGAATAAVGETAGKALESGGTGRRPEGREEASHAEGPALGIRADTDELRGKAEEFLRNSGAHRIWVQRTRSG